MNITASVDELNFIAEQLSREIDEVSLVGDGISYFLIASNNEYGVEIYKEGDVVIIDSSLNDESLGEKEFTDVSVAIQSALAWLLNGAAI